MHEAVGLQDMSAFAKYEVSGPGAEAFLDGLVANKLPQKVGRLALTHLLSPNGGVRSEFTVFREAADRFYLVGMGSAERHDFDYLSKLRPRDGSVDLQKVTTQYGVLILAGPRARDVLQSVTDADLSSKAFPWLSGKTIDVGAAHARALRVNFVGELGWELHHPIEMQNTIFDLLMEAGRPHGIKPFGMRAMDSLRLEKSYRLIPRELSIEYCALESGLDRFVHLNKGRVHRPRCPRRMAAAGLRQPLRHPRGAGRRRTPTPAAPSRSGRTAVSSAAAPPAASAGASASPLRLPWCSPDLGEIGSELDVTILGTPHRAIVIPDRRSTRTICA